MNVRALWLLALAIAAPAWAGQECTHEIATPHAQAAAADQALEVAAALDAMDAPAALLARVGTDLSAHGLHYSHVGIVVRDGGQWRVVHLLNDCGSSDGAMYVDGLLDFYLAARISLDTAIVWLDIRTATRVAATITDHSAAGLFDPDYNVIANPRSERYQNCTGFVLEVLALAMDEGQVSDRAHAQRLAADTGFVPHTLHIPYSRRIVGGLFSANAHFTDHPLRDRLSGEYDVVTVEAIFDWLARNGRVLRREDWHRARDELRPAPEQPLCCAPPPRT